MPLEDDNEHIKKFTQYESNDSETTIKSVNISLTPKTKRESEMPLEYMKAQATSSAYLKTKNIQEISYLNKYLF